LESGTKVIHSNKGQTAGSILGIVQEGNIKILVATDVASRELIFKM